MSKSKKHIIIGLSGGVDSSVGALLLKQQGYQLTGVFMQNWEADLNDQNCSGAQDLSDARAVSDKLNIPLKTVNFAKEYWNKVFAYFLDELAAGRTPNPDILCNQEIKFKAFLNYALELGGEAIATGHYARIVPKGNQYHLYKAVDQSKDQSYFLSRLNEHQLSHSLFPLGTLEKKFVRQLAKEAGLITSNKKDSTGICFIGERKFNDFLREYMLLKPGNIETPQGVILGRHQGLMFYTLGQREGIGIGGMKGYREAPWYVVQKDIATNTLVVDQDSLHPLLMKDRLKCEQVTWINGSPSFPLTCLAKIRYRQADQPCVVYEMKNQYEVVFDHPQRAITPGQAVVFYEQERCLGGGVII